MPKFRDQDFHGFHKLIAPGIRPPGGSWDTVQQLADRIAAAIINGEAWDRRGTPRPPTLRPAGAFPPYAGRTHTPPKWEIERRRDLLQ